MKFSKGSLVWIVSGESIWQGEVVEVKHHTGSHGGYTIITNDGEHYADADEVYSTSEEARESIPANTFTKAEPEQGFAYAIRTADGYFAHQHNHDWSTTKWFEKEPVGWALIASESGAKQVAEYHLPDTEYTIEKVSI